MKSILLIGVGRFGRHMAEKLDALGHRIFAIDTEEERIQSVLPFVTHGEIGDSTNMNFLRSLGVEDFDVCMVTISGDFQSSLETTSLLKELGAKRVVSRAEQDVQAKFLLRNGADDIVYPEKQVGEWAAIRYSSDNILDYINLDEKYCIVEVPVPKNWIGKTIVDLDVRRKCGINVMGVKVEGKLQASLSADTVFTGEGTILALGEYTALQKCFDL